MMYELISPQVFSFVGFHFGFLVFYFFSVTIGASVFAE